MIRLSSAFSVMLLCLSTSPALCELHDFTDTVAGHPGVTYAALLRQVVPDLKQDGDNWKGAALPHLRHLLGKDYDNGQPDELVVLKVDVRHACEAGHDRLLLMAMDGQGENGWFALLAAFDDSKTPRLLDAANTGADQYNGF